MSLYVPSFAEVLEVSQAHGKSSCNPDGWNDLAGLWTKIQGGGKTLYDISGYGKHGTLSDDFWTTSDRGRIIKTPGIDAKYVSIPASASSMGLGDTGTCMARFRIDTWNNGDDIVILGTTTANNYSFYIRTASTSTFRVWLQPVGADPGVVTSPALAAGVWLDVAVVWRLGISLILYIDGKQVGIDNNVDAGGLQNATETLALGASNLGFQAAFVSYDNVTFYNRAFTFSEIQHQFDHPNDHLTLRPRVYPTAVAGVGGHPTMRRWGGIPHMMPGPQLAGRSW